MDTSSYDSDIVSPSALSEADIATWQRWSEENPPLAAPHLTYSYACAAENVFYGVKVCKITLSDRLVALFPFQFASSFYRILGIGERVGGQLSDYFGIVAEPGTTLEPRLLLKLAHLSALRFTNLEVSQSSFGLTADSQEIGHWIDFPRGGAAYWEARKQVDKRFVTDTERRERKAVEKYGPVRFTFCEPDWEEPLAHLMSAKRAQYARTSVPDALGDQRNRDFLKRLAGSRDRLCSGAMSTLYAGETWIASHFGLVCNKTLHYWFPVYNPELRALSPGRLLIKSIIDSSDETGLMRIDRGAGDAVAKRDFSTSSHHFGRGLWHRTNAVSAGYRLGLSLHWRLASKRRLTDKSEAE